MFNTGMRMTDLLIFPFLHICDSEHDHNEDTDLNSQHLWMENGNFEKLREVLLDSDDDSSVDWRFSNRNYVFQHLYHKNGNYLRDE